MIKLHFIWLTFQILTYNIQRITVHFKLFYISPSKFVINEMYKHNYNWLPANQVSYPIKKITIQYIMTLPR